MMDEERRSSYAPVVLRLGMSAVILWFGFNELFNTAHFVEFLPGFLYNSPYAASAVLANGVLEVAFGLLLAVGLFTRVVAIVLAAHLTIITIGLGYGDSPALMMPEVPVMRQCTRTVRRSLPQRTPIMISRRMDSREMNNREMDSREPRLGEPRYSGTEISRGAVRRRPSSRFAAATTPRR